MNIIIKILIFITLLSHQSQAQIHTPTKGQSFLEKITLNYGGWRAARFTKKAARKSTRASNRYTNNVLAHQGQAILLIMILTGVDLVRQHVEQSNLTLETIDKDLLASHIKEAAGHVVNSGEIWSSLIGAGVVSGISAKPLQIINSLIQNGTSNGMLKKFLQAGISTFVTFIGWELGGQLYTEAVELIEDESDYQKAQGLGTLLGRSLKYGIFLHTADSADDWRVLKVVFNNMMKILWHNHELRNLWLYNAWRKRIATGEFVTLVTSMVTAGVVGTTLFPGAGTIAGMMFGVSGGVLSLFIPHEYKNQITRGIKSTRHAFWRIGHDTKGFGFKVRKQVIRIASTVIKKNQPMPPMLHYPKNSKSENKIMSIHFETLFILESIIQSTKAKIELGEKSGNTVATEELRQELILFEQSFLHTLDEIVKFYKNEYEYLSTAVSKTGLNEFNNVDKISQYPILKNIFDDINASKNFLDVFNSFKVMALEKEQSKDYLKMLHRFYIFGFEKKILLNILNET